MGSSRLPGKVMMNSARIRSWSTSWEEPLASGAFDEVVVATTTASLTTSSRRTRFRAEHACSEEARSTSG